MKFCLKQFRKIFEFKPFERQTSIAPRDLFLGIEPPAEVVGEHYEKSDIFNKGDAYLYMFKKVPKKLKIFIGHLITQTIWIAPNLYSRNLFFFMFVGLLIIPECIKHEYSLNSV